MLGGKAVEHGDDLDFGVAGDGNRLGIRAGADFFRLQLQATLFDRWIADFVKVTHIPVAWTELLWQFLSLFAILWGCYSIAELLFAEERARWAGVAMVAAMF